ncbi:MAG TPA: hypothetical protein IAA53_08720 [Candidatus Avoscillospira avicola]|uniref:Uncharacterized protein n=1 Tax=Candidatus Avoscillospira avicola TaxID=2840706 RepID=A0A9D1DIR5_9FIRM|nr:hypothetical protein [Candidatus Avoscillospira avicola]
MQLFEVAKTGDSGAKILFRHAEDPLPRAAGLFSVSKNAQKRDRSLAEFRRQSGEIKLKLRFPVVCVSEIAPYATKGSTAFQRKPRPFGGAIPFVKKAWLF